MKRYGVPSNTNASAAAVYKLDEGKKNDDPNGCFFDIVLISLLEVRPN
jgi:hypothetical protein